MSISDHHFLVVSQHWILAREESLLKLTALIMLTVWQTAQAAPIEPWTKSLTCADQQVRQFRSLSARQATLQNEGSANRWSQFERN
ncbi:hypothetical protein [Pseudoduganella sp. RAF53_2]|uniref:hypothetical protein n=1 Tax=unclassified Pseudoduganella TaxID=2637179 RepID=UPI003F9D24DB